MKKRSTTGKAPARIPQFNEEVRGRLRSAYLAAEGYTAELLEELGPAALGAWGRLVLSAEAPRACAWAQNSWLHPEILEFESISEAARLLRERQRNWAVFSFHLHRRALLIQEKLPKVSAKPTAFLAPPPRAPLGSWSLLDARTLLASSACSSPYPHGEVRFVEDREGPPSRAYLKLWEVFTVLGVRPNPGELCLDLGSSPGGWTWVLSRVGARVISVDKAPLAAGATAWPGVEFRQQNAFSLEPEAVGPVDWLFSDIVCYPERLWTLVERWRRSGLCSRFVCTLKFQGATDHAVARRFAEIPGSRLVHLAHNKHELTWILA